MTNENNNSEQVKQFPKCKDCRFYKNDDYSCHRYAPRPENPYAKESRWPTTSENDFCGEFKAIQHKPDFNVWSV